MGFFSNKKEETALNDAKKNELIKCPVCDKTSFHKVDYFYYFKDKGRKAGDTKFLEQEKQDCSQYLGDNTGYCTDCGGIVRGLIFLPYSEDKKEAMEIIVSECNRAFVKTFIDIFNEVKSGKKEFNLKSILDAYKSDNKNALDTYNMRTHLILALNGAGMKFSPDIDTKLEELIKKYRFSLNVIKVSRESQAQLADKGINLSDDAARKNIDTFIKAFASYIG